MSVTVNGSNGITFNDGSSQTAAASPFGLKNRIINGDMRIDQRNAGASITVTTGNVYGADRFNSSKSTSSGTMTVQQSTTAPTGFKNSLLHTVSTGASPAAGDQNRVEHCVEGYNFADLDFGTANAKTFTFSFWVRSSVTGTYAVAFLNAAWNRSYVATYTVSSANTWEQKTITIAGDTTGTWATDNTVGIRFKFDLGSGSTSNTATPNQWVSGEYYRTSSTVTLLSTTGATFYITGVQLEVGSTATPFERRMYGNELALCQRYCFVDGYVGNAYTRFPLAYATSTTQSLTVLSFPVTMRTVPSLTWSGPFAEVLNTGGGATGTSVTITGDGNSDNHVSFLFNYSSGSVGSNSINAIRINNSTTWKAIFSAEL